MISFSCSIVISQTNDSLWEHVTDHQSYITAPIGLLFIHFTNILFGEAIILKRHIVIFFIPSFINWITKGGFLC